MNQNGDSDNENTQKENFLYQEIIGQGYDPDQFENYAQKLFPDKDTVADWSFDELRQVILDFKQQQDYIQQLPKQMKSSKIVPRQIQINSIELDSNISIDEFRRYVKCKDQQFCLDQKINLNFQVSEHLEKNPLKKLINEIEYEIKTISLNYCVKRKYSDFQSLNKNLQIIYPEYEYQFIKLPDKISSPEQFQNLLVEFYKKPLSRIFEAAKSFLCNQKLFDDQKYQNYFNQLQAKSSQSGFLEISLSKQSYETNQQIINFMKSPENLKSIDYIKKAELKFKEGFQQINLALDSFNAHNDQIPNSFKKELTNKTIKLKNLLKETSWHFQLSLFGFSGTLNQIFIQFQNISNNLDQQIKKNTQLQLNLYNYYKDSFIPSQKKFLANQNVIEALKNMNLKLETINQVKIYENVCRTLTKSNPSLVPIELEKLEEIQNETAYYITQTNIYSKQIFEETFQNIDAIIQKYQTTTLEDNKKHNFCFNENVVWIEFFDIFKKILQLMSLKYETIISQFLEKLKPKLPLKNNQIKDALQTFLGQNHLEFGNHIILFKWAIQIKSQKIKELTIQTLIYQKDISKEVQQISQIFIHKKQLRQMKIDQKKQLKHKVNKMLLNLLLRQFLCVQWKKKKQYNYL